MFVDFNILNQLGSPSINSNTFANRPAAGQTGRLFVSIDTFEIYRDNGTTWDLIGGPGTSTVTGTGAATQVAYWTAAQSIGGSNNLWWDNTNGFLGVGSAVPSARIEAVKTDGIGIYANYTTNAGTGSSATAIWAKNITNSSGYGAVIEETTPNNTGGQYPLLIKHSLSTGTAAVGMGTGVHWQLPDDAGTFKTTQLTVETTDAAAATYKTRYRFNVQNNGSSTPVAYINATGLGLFTATPSAALDVHSTGVMLQLNSTSATANSLLAFQRSGSGLWRIGDAYNGGNNFFELHNTVLTNNAIQVLASSNEATFLSSKTYSTGNAIGIAVQHNLTIPNGVNVGLAALGGVNSNLNLTLQGSTTVANTGRQGLEGSTSISFTGAGTLTMTQGSTVRAFSALSSVYAFNGSAVGTITHLAGLRICFPDNVGSAVNITNNYALLINNQTTGTGTVTYTNRWGIYQEGASDLNYFAGNSLFGTTTNVGAKISIAGYMYISNRPLAQIVFNSTGTYYGQIQNDAADKWSFARNTVNDGTLGTSIMTWDATNIRVGINTSSPNSIFEVKSTGTGTNTIVGAFRDSSTNGNGIEIYNANGVSSIYSTYYTGASNQDLAFFTTTNTGAQNEVLRLTSTQRVGISTSTPQYKLDITNPGYGMQHYGDVNNSLRTYAGSTYQIIEATNSGTVNQFGYFGGGFFIDTSATARFRITTGGNVLINTSTNSGQTLQVNGNASFAGNIVNTAGALVYTNAVVNQTNRAITIRKSVGFNGSNTTPTILQIDVPAKEYFIVVEALIIKSRASGTLQDVGTSQVNKWWFAIARNGSGYDVVLNNNLGTNGWAVTTTSAGGTENMNAISPSIARSGAEANTATQGVKITVDITGSGSNYNACSAIFNINIVGEGTDVQFT